MRIGIVGGGVIARLVLEHARSGAVEVVIVGVLGRNHAGRAERLAREFAVPFVTRLEGLLELQPDAVIEAASHAAVHQYVGRLLAAGISVIVLSAGALCDDALRLNLERCAAQGKALLHVPSGGIGGLDALKAACEAGVEEVAITVTKPPAAWKNIPYVERLDLDLDRLAERVTLFAGTARDGVPHFPANVNIAAVLAMAGVGFDETRLEVVADPALKYNTHTITIRGKTGTIEIKLASVPAPDNPKTALLACYSAIAALKALRAPVRYGT